MDMELIVSWSIEATPSETELGARFVAKHPEDGTVIDIRLSDTNATALNVESDLTTKTVELLVNEHGKALDRACRRFWLGLSPEDKGKKHLAMLEPANGDLYLSRGHEQD